MPDIYGNDDALVISSMQQMVAAVQPNRDQRIDYENIAGSDKPVYIGVAPPGTDPSANNWSIQYIVWATGPAGSLVPSVIRMATGAWNNRAQLFP